MKKFALTLLAVLLLGTVPVSAAAIPLVETSGINVTGTGTVKVKPDIAVLDVGVTTTGATTAIQQENTEIMNKVMEAVKEAGVSEADIQTSSFYLSPNYDYGTAEISYSGNVVSAAPAPSTPTITGYTMYHTIEVKVRDIALAGDILTKATEAGANVNNGVSFRLSDPDTYYLQALEKAIANAKAKADVVAVAMGKPLGTKVSVSESNSYSPYYSNYNMRATAAYDVALGTAAPVESGMLEVSATVSVTYAE